MKQAYLTTFFLTIFTAFVFGQNLAQTVSGTIKDADSHLPLIGVTISIVNSDPIIGTSTDINGQFRLAKIPIGRISLQLSYLVIR